MSSKSSKVSSHTGLNIEKRSNWLVHVCTSQRGVINFVSEAQHVPCCQLEPASFYAHDCIRRHPLTSAHSVSTALTPDFSSAAVWYVCYTVFGFIPRETLCLWAWLTHLGAVRDTCPQYHLTPNKQSVPHVFIDLYRRPRITHGANFFFFASYCAWHTVTTGTPSPHSFHIWNCSTFQMTGLHLAEMA